MAGACRQSVTMHQSQANPFETCTIWEDSGFRPPVDLVLGVEMLHHLSMAEDGRDDALTSLAYELLARLNETCALQDEYIITDPAEMVRTAIAYGVPVTGKEPEEIARAIAGEIVADYLPDRKGPEY